MEYQKILNILNEASNSKLVTRNYDAGNEVMYTKKVWKSILFDYNDAYILLREDIINTAHNNPNLVAFKNWAPFVKCITKVDGTTIDDGKDLDLMLILQTQMLLNLLSIRINY